MRSSWTSTLSYITARLRAPGSGPRADHISSGAAVSPGSGRGYVVICVWFWNDHNQNIQNNNGLSVSVAAPSVRERGARVARGGGVMLFTWVCVCLCVCLHTQTSFSMTGLFLLPFSGGKKDDKWLISYLATQHTGLTDNTQSWQGRIVKFLSPFLYSHVVIMEELNFCLCSFPGTRQNKPFFLRTPWKVIVVRNVYLWSS